VSVRLFLSITAVGVRPAGYICGGCRLTGFTDAGTDTDFPNPGHR